MKTISATEFKAKCLALLDEVKQTGEVITILKRGKPTAQLVPPVPRDNAMPQETLIGSVQIIGDVVGPVIDASFWEAEGGSNK